jgi:hypothetical protein
MDIGAFKRDLSSVEDGRWVGDDEVPDLAGVRVKVRGMSSAKARAMYDRKQRAVKKAERDAKGQLKASASVRIMREMVEEWALVDIEGLTENGKPITVDRVKEVLADPALEPLFAAIMDAVACVDATRAEDADDLAGN